jgi:hypothetical protein
VSKFFGRFGLVRQVFSVDLLLLLDRCPSRWAVLLCKLVSLVVVAVLLWYGYSATTLLLSIKKEFTFIRKQNKTNCRLWCKTFY